MPHNLHNTLQSFKSGKLYSLPALGKALNVNVARLPVSIRIVLESVLRNCDGKKVTEEHVRELANWKPAAKRTEEIPFVVARIVLQDFTGVPLLCDLAAMRGVADKMGGPQGDRAAGAGRPGGRPLGADRPFRQQERARPQHE